MLNPINRRYLKATAVDSAVVGMTEYQWRVIRRVREKFDEPEHVLSLATARNSIRDLVEQAVSKRTKKRRVRALGSWETSNRIRWARTNWSTIRSPRQILRLNDVTHDSLFHEGSRHTLGNPLQTAVPSAAVAAPDELDVDSWDVAV